MTKSEAYFITQKGDANQAFQLQNTEVKAPQSGEVLIEVEAFGLNYADVMARNGLYNDAPPLPYIPGYEVVGRIVSCGEGVSSFRPNDRVLAFTRFGGYARHSLADARAVRVIPANMNVGTATALATQYCTAYYSAILMANIQENEEVLIHAAAGGVGTALIQLAKWRKCTIYGTAGSDEKLEFIKNQGANIAINYRKEDYEKTIKQLKDKERIDVVFNPIGGKTFKKDQRILSWGGRHVLFGVSTWSGSKGNIFDKLKLVWDFGFYHPLGLLMKSQSTIGVNMLRIADVRPNTIGQCMESVIQLQQQGILNPHSGGVFNDVELAKAHTLLENRSTMGKLTIKWS